MDQQEFLKLKSKAMELLSHHKDLIETKEELIEISKNEALVSEVMKEVKKEYYAARSKKGLQKLVIGSVLLLTSFLVTYINFHAGNSITFVMYGFTSVGSVLIIWGLYEIIG